MPKTTIAQKDRADKEHTYTGVELCLVLKNGVNPAFSSRKIILTNRKDGALLSADEGPLHIIIEGEKRKLRNARQVICIKVKFAN